MIELRDYQNRAVNLTRQAILDGHKRPLLVLPTGAGKSAIFGQIIAVAVQNGKTCLFLVHRRGLVTQFAETLWKHFRIEAGVIMSGVDFSPGKQVYLSTIQTYCRRVQLSGKAFAKYFIEADVILIDEAHTSVSKRYQDVIELYSDKIVIGTTATPARTDGTGLGEVYDKLIDVANVSKLTANGFLSPIRYFAPVSLDLSRVKVKMGEYDQRSLAGKVDKPKIIGDVVLSWLKLAENRKTIVFAVNVKHSVHLAEEFRKSGVSAAHLDAKSTDQERDRIFRQMENGEITVICNVGLYVEGTDVPDISCICMAHPTKSLVKYRQCIGRGLRPSPGKKDLVLLDFGNVVEEHGFVDDDIEWTLDGKELAYNKKEKTAKEKLSTCRSCKEVFRGQKKCPLCGTELKTFGRSVVAAEGELTELKAKPEKDTGANKRIYLGMLKYWVNEKGYSPKMVNAKYKTKFGCWPHHSIKDVAPIKPDQKFLNRMKHDMIKFIKGRKNV